MEAQMRALLLAVMAMVVLDGSAPDALAAVSDGGGPGASALTEARDAIAAQPATASTTTSENTVRLRVAVTGDLLIHSPVFDRALANGGGQRYDFAPIFATSRRT
jgi:hypothetical protein